MAEDFAAVDHVGVQRSGLRSVIDLLLILVRDYVLDLALLTASFIIASYFRMHLPLGQIGSSDCSWISISIVELCAESLGVVYLIRLVPAGARPRSSARRAWMPLLGAVLATIAGSLRTSSEPWLQRTYFIVFVAVLSILVVMPMGDSDHRRPMRFHLGRLWANRSLLRIWVQYNVQSRYAQAFLGILWMVLLPLSTAFILSLVYAQLLRISVGNVPFIAFVLAGLVPWGLFNQSIGAGMRSILNALGLISQIYFPREIIVLSALGEALVDTFFMFVAMVVINGFIGVWPNPNYVFLLVLLVIQLALTSGIMLLVSWLSVFVRDVPQLVSVLLQMLFYLSPIIYPLNIVPARFRAFLTLNPLATLINGYHDVIVYNRAPDWLSLVYPAVMGICLLTFGYRTFKNNEETLADLV